MKEYNIKTYTDLIKELILVNPLNIVEIQNILEAVSFSEPEEYMYNNLPIEASYAQLEIVDGGEALVKVVKLTQADNHVLILPQHVTEAYNLILEDATIISSLNRDVDLYAEIHGFNTTDPELTKLIKTTYLNIGNRLLPFELSVIAKVDEEVEASEAGGFDSDSFEDFENEDLDDFDDFLTNEETALNEESFKKFRGSEKSFDGLRATLKDNLPTIILENIKVKRHHNLLVIKINNNKIYEHLNSIPKLAKQLITKAGELVRNNKGTQLVESKNLNKKRFFVVAEANNSNFWRLEDDSYVKFNSKSSYIKPIQKNIIVLNNSNIRVENRTYKPSIDTHNNIVFIKKVFKNGK